MSERNRGSARSAAGDRGDGRAVGGRYVLLERLGAGTSADVWRARDERTGTHVAVKLLHAWLLPDPVSRARFESEARAVQRLRHRGIVAVRDVVLAQDEAAIVMDLVPGGTLADRLRREGALGDGEAARIAADVASALAEAHAMGVVHRDVKPGNVLLDADGRPRLADFGIARSLDDSQGLTVTGTVMGSLRYMAPEQLGGAPASPAADVFALGAVLYEMLAGRPAFDATSPGALIEQQRHDPPAIPGVDPVLASIALTALRPDQASRTSSARGLERSLRGWLAGEAGVDHRSPSIRLWAPTAGVIEPPEPSRDPAASRDSVRRPLASAADARSAARGGTAARGRATRRAARPYALAALVLAVAVAAVAAGWNGLASVASGWGQGSTLGNVEAPSAPAPSATSPAATTPRPTPSATPRQVVAVVRLPPAPRPTQHHKGHGRGHGGQGDSGDG